MNCITTNQKYVSWKQYRLKEKCHFDNLLATFSAIATWLFNDLDNLYLGIWKLSCCLVSWVWISLLILNLPWLFFTNKSISFIYKPVNVITFSFLNKFLQCSVLLELVIILIACFCIINTLWTCVLLSYNSSPYFKMLWK